MSGVWVWGFGGHIILSAFACRSASALCRAAVGIDPALRGGRAADVPGPPRLEFAPRNPAAQEVVEADNSLSKV